MARTRSKKNENQNENQNGSKAAEAADEPKNQAGAEKQNAAQNQNGESQPQGQSASGPQSQNGDQGGDNVVSIEQGLNRSRAQQIMGELRNLKQKVDDAQMSYAEYFKRLQDKSGMDTKAVKMVRQIDRMAWDKRRAFLNEFDRWRSCLGWDDQQDLFEQANNAGGSSEAAE